MSIDQSSVRHTEPNHESGLVSVSRTDAANTPSSTSTQREDASLHSAAWRRDELQQELRTLIFKTAATAAPTRQCTPDGLAANQDGVSALVSPLSGNIHDSEQQTVEYMLCQGRNAEYLANYISEIAPWLDMFDSHRAFGIQVPLLARSTPALMYAMLALSARHLERKAASSANQSVTGNSRPRSSGSLDSLELYQEAIRLVGPLLEVRDFRVVPICTILCVMEMMSVSAQGWRQHLEGCAALFDAFGVHGFSGQLSQAVFWCYARMDLCGALISDGTQSTLVPLSRWAPSVAIDNAQDVAGLFCASKDPDMHANYAVYLCSKVCDLIASRTQFVELGNENGCDDSEYTARWLCLWTELQRWTDERPVDILPIQVVEASESSPFPHVLFLHWAAISSTQLYHTACLLLLGMLPLAEQCHLPRGQVGSQVYHAKRICGISQTNPHQGCLNNAIQPLWLAGRLLSHPVEHKIVVELIRDIEATTGWGTSWRIPDLEVAWGFRAE
ncbi:uncharacterized protein PgNI_12424 [Pyricularia grisea]|uniref:C6 transcription factor n=1 Tax=Pyricularia grisea TaxID=148305 RepID=A0A6P8AMG1_PYRGI|nr:uncharacterized protein PgNI_12424 [Pyricularia grisea]TLD03217.1 hypothetical protein PgNI_12424 [Pyricularia grisea]